MAPTKRNNPRRDAAQTLVLTRIFAAPRALVFAAWTDGEQLSRWCAPKGFTIPFSEGDIRPGGAWRSCMRTPDGVDCWLSGKYLALEKDRRIVFSHAWEEAGRRGHETTVTVELSNLGTKTKLTLRQEFFANAAERDGHGGGWSQCLDRLRALLRELQSR